MGVDDDDDDEGACGSEEADSGGALGVPAPRSRSTPRW